MSATSKWSLLRRCVMIAYLRVYYITVYDVIMMRNGIKTIVMIAT